MQIKGAKQAMNIIMWCDFVCLGVCYVMGRETNFQKTVQSHWSENKELCFKKSMKCLKLFTIRCNQRYSSLDCFKIIILSHTHHMFDRDNYLLVSPKEWANANPAF